MDTARTPTALMNVTALALAGTLLAGCTSAPPEPVGADPAPESSAGSAASYDATTRDDDAFTGTFRHEFTRVEVDGLDAVEMHHVVGGEGPPLVLLHGWPQTGQSWREVMRELAEHFTVHAVDLPGLGDSEGAPPSYDKATLARYITGLLDELGLDDVRLAAHDLGAGVAFQVLAQRPELVTRYAHLDYPLPGPALGAADYRTFSWHLAFHSQPDAPELLVDDEVEDYLAAFYPYVAHEGAAFGGTSTDSPFTEEEVTEYARTYARDEVLSGGFELYRTLDVDEADNRRAGAVRVPTMLMSAEGGMAGMRATTDPLLPDVRRAVEVPDAGHWLVEENPEVVTEALVGFLR